MPTSRICARPLYPANSPGPLGLPDFMQLKAECPRRPASEPALARSDDVQREANTTGNGQLIGSLDTMGDFYSYVIW